MGAFVGAVDGTEEGAFDGVLRLSVGSVDGIEEGPLEGIEDGLLVAASRVNTWAYPVLIPLTPSFQ